MSQMHIFTTEIKKKKEKRKMIRCYFGNLNLNFPFFFVTVILGPYEEWDSGPWF